MVPKLQTTFQFHHKSSRSRYLKRKLPKHSPCPFDDVVLEIPFYFVLLPLPFNSKSWLIRLNNTDQYYFYLPISLYHLLMWNCDEWAHIFPCIRHWLVIIECTQSFIWYTKPYLNLTTCWKVHYITALIEVPFEISLACSCCKFPLFNVYLLIVQVTAVAIWKSRAIL